MDKSTFLGMVGGLSLIMVAIVSQGSLVNFLSVASLIIVLGGVFATSLINFSWEDLLTSIKTLQEALSENAKDFRTDIELMNMFSRKARREGLLKLEDDVEYMADPFLKDGLQLAIDGITKENLDNILEDQINSLKRRQQVCADMFEGMAEYAPAFGMIGTVIGLILMLQNISDPTSLGRGLSVALLTTLYGTVLGNMVFSPLAGKMRFLGNHEIAHREMLRAGIMSLVNEENPRIMENKMLSYVPPEKRAEYIAFYDDRPYDKQREERLYNNWISQQQTQWNDLLKALETGL